jgi:hypothetical protein
MTMVNVPELVLPANFRPASGSSPGIGNQAVNEDGDQCAFVFEVPVTGTIIAIGFGFGTITTPANLSVGLETLNVSGDPSGTAYGGSAPKTDFDPTGLASTFQWATLATAATGATAGNRVAAVIKAAGVGSISLNIMSGVTQMPTVPGMYRDFYDETGAAWTKTVSCLVMALKYSGDVIHYCGAAAIKARNAISYHVDTATFDEYALKFKLLFKARIKGASVVMNVQAGEDFIVKLFEGTTERATSGVIDGDHSLSQGAHRVLFTTPYTIAANTFYYLSLIPNTVNPIGLETFDIQAAADMAGVDGGVNFIMGKRLNGGAWTDVDTSRPWIHLIIDQVDDGSAAGGSSGILSAPLLGGVLQ